MLTPNEKVTQTAVRTLINDIETKITQMQNLLEDLRDQYHPLLCEAQDTPAPSLVEQEQQRLFPEKVDYNVPVRGSTLSHHIYWALESQNKGEFTTRSLAHFLKKAEKYKTQTFESFRTKIQNTLKSMRRNPKQWPNLGWRETRRPQGGTIYMYRWQK